MSSAAATYLLMKKGLIGKNWMPIMGVIFAIIGLVLFFYSEVSQISGFLFIMGSALLFTSYSIISSKKKK